MNYACTACHAGVVKNDYGRWVHIPISREELLAVQRCPAYGRAVAQPYAVASEDNGHVDAQLAALWNRSK